MHLNKSKTYIIILLVIFLLQLSYTLKNMREQGYNFINYYTVLHNDNSELYGPAENLLQNGTYSLEGDVPYTGRIPGIAAIYIPLRLIFEQNTTFTLLTITSLLAYLFLIFCFFNFLQKKTNKDLAFLAMLMLLLLTSFSGFTQTSPESYATVFAITGFFFLFKVFQTSEKKRYFWSGLFLMLAVTFRGYLIPSMLAVAAMIFTFLYFKKGLKRAVTLTLLFTISLFVYFGMWTARNYLVTSEIIVLQKAERHYKSPYKNSIQVTKTTFKRMGFETVEFYPISPMNYLMGRDSIPPANFYETINKFAISKEQVDSLRDSIKESYQTNNKVLEERIIAFNKELQKTIKENAGFINFYIFVPLKNLLRSYTFNFTSGWGLPAWTEANILEKMYRLSIWFSFHILMLLSILASIYSIITKKELFISLIWITWVSSMFFTYTYLLNQIEFKYYGTLMPLSIIVSALILINFKNDKSQNKNVQ